MTPAVMFPIKNTSGDTFKGCSAKDPCGDGAESLFFIKAFIDQLVPKSDTQLEQRNGTDEPVVDKDKLFLELQETKRQSGNKPGIIQGKKVYYSSEKNWEGAGSQNIDGGDIRRSIGFSADMTAFADKSYPEGKTGDQKKDNIGIKKEKLPGSGGGNLRNVLRNQSDSVNYSENNIDKERSRKNTLRGTENKQTVKLSMALPGVSENGEAVELESKVAEVDNILAKEKVELTNTGLNDKGFSKRLFHDVESKRYFEYSIGKDAGIDPGKTEKVLASNVNAANRIEDQQGKNVDANLRITSNVSGKGTNETNITLERGIAGGRENQGNILNTNNYAININENQSMNKLAERINEGKYPEVESGRELSQVTTVNNKKDKLTESNRKYGESTGPTRRMGVKDLFFKDVLPESKFKNEPAQKEMSLKNSADVSNISRTGSVDRSDSPVGNVNELSSRVMSDVEGKLLEQIEIIQNRGTVGKETEIKIKLFPQELGELKLTVLIKEGKRIKASFITDNVSARNIITGGAEKLSEVISRHGFVLENLDVSVGNPDDNAEKGKWEYSSDVSGNSEFNHESNRKRVPVIKPAEDGINLLV